MTNGKADRLGIEVLVVEDSPTQAEKLRFILEKEGYRVSIASNGKEGFLSLKKLRPDIVVTDVIMPEMDGYELCRQIRREFDFAEMPVILLTALSDPTDVIKGLEAGANNFVTKPYDEEVLLSRIDHILQNRNIRRDPKSGPGNDVFFSGRSYHIDADRLQILDLLLSTYENAYHQNLELRSVQKALTDLNDRLEETIRERDTEIEDHKHSEEALRKSFERVDILSSTASELLMSQTPQRVVERLCRRVMEHLDCHAFFNFLVDDEKGCLRLNAYGGIPEEAAREIEFLDFGVAVCGCAARDGCRIVAENIPATSDPRTDLVRSYGIKAYAAHPLFAQGRVIGTLSFGTKSRLIFQPDELSLMKTVADQVATAMERVRLLRQAEERADELESRVRQRTEELQQAYDKLVAETREREQVEARLRQAQKMEAVGTLAGGIAHDFNNILAAIIGFSDIARDRIPADSSLRRYVDRIFSAGIRGRELVKQILMFSRQAEQEKSPLQVSSVIKETLKLLRPSIPSTIDIQVNVTNESGTVLADLTQIEQVVLNLCTNAAHAMRQSGGLLTIELSDVSFLSPQEAPEPSLAPGSYVRLTVSDTGEGIAPALLERIFDPFFTTKPQGEGTGLGLSVVHGIVSSHKGVITVRSEQGKGSAFSVYLPVYSDEQKASIKDEGGVPRGSGRVLFVDDEEALVEMGADILEDLGYDVVPETNSRSALTRVRLDPQGFDLVITDMTMPELTGIELAEEVLRLRSDMPIILCTGFSHLVDSAVAQRAGVRAFAMKPLTKAEIAHTIKKVLDRTN